MPSHDYTPPANRSEAATRPPANLDAEASVLGAILIDATLVSVSLARQIGIRRKAFTSLSHQLIWDAIETLTKNGEIPDVSLVAAHLHETGQLDEAGGYEALGHITARTPTNLQHRYFCDQVKFLWDVRHAITVAGNFAAGCGQLATRQEFVDAAGKLGTALIGLGRKQTTAPLADDISAVYAEVLARAAGTEDRSGWIHTGLQLYDHTYLPWGCQREDGFIVLAGGSSMGKSAGMRQVAAHALGQGKRVLVFSRETSNAGFCEGVAGSRARIDLRRPQNSPKDRLEAFTAECAELTDLADKRLFCVQHTPATPMLHVEDIEDHVRAFAHLRGMPDLVVVDYLQLFGTRKRCGSREQEVAHISHTLQALQRSLGGVWCVGCQMNEAGLAEMRTPKRDADGRIIHRLPHAGDLRESQAIYHDADRVIALYLPAEDSAGNLQNGPGVLSPEVWWVQIKRRRGGTGYVRTRFEKQFQVFTELGLDSDTSASSKPAFLPPKGTVPLSKNAIKGGGIPY